MIKLKPYIRAVLAKIWHTIKWGTFIQLHKKKIENGEIFIAEAWVKNKGYDIVSRNWGDELNKYFLEYITHKKFYFIPFTQSCLKPMTHYVLIGSILTFYNLNKSIIYGSGILVPEKGVAGVPEKVISVRGPKTRDILLKSGIECPEVYGDPALLLPVFYQPKLASGKKKIIVIPHMNTSIKVVKGTCNGIMSDYSILSLFDYNRWTDIVDAICSAKFVVSESLHGLIVAEAYGIPSVWVEFKDHPDYWDFKYNDFYASINKTRKKIKLQEKPDYEDIQSQINTWIKGEIPYDEILSHFPFVIDSKILQ